MQLATERRRADEIGSVVGAGHYSLAASAGWRFIVVVVARMEGYNN